MGSKTALSCITRVYHKGARGRGNVKLIPPEGRRAPEVRKKLKSHTQQPRNLELPDLKEAGMEHGRTAESVALPVPGFHLASTVLKSMQNVAIPYSNLRIFM